jgi:hypothetical protein
LFEASQVFHVEHHVFDGGDVTHFDVSEIQYKKGTPKSAFSKKD